MMLPGFKESFQLAINHSSIGPKAEHMAKMFPVWPTAPMRELLSVTLTGWAQERALADPPSVGWCIISY